MFYILRVHTISKADLYFTKKKKNIIIQFVLLIKYLVLLLRKLVIPFQTPYYLIGLSL